MSNASLEPFDALILVSFGGPEKPEDVLPFLQNVTRGRGIPDERLVEVGEHYYNFGGRSPINEQNRNLLDALNQELQRRDIRIPLLWGNRNWDPYLTDEVRKHAQQTGATRFLAITTSAYSSYSSCRQYREDFGGSVQALAEDGIEVSFDKVRQYYNHPGFAEAELQCVRRALSEFQQNVGELDPDTHRVLYVTHSIPATMQDASQRYTAGYQAEHEQLIQWIEGQLPEEQRLPSELVYCSRSGSPHTPWLEPDVNDRMRELAAEGIDGVVVVPLGFVSDHMEVKYDLDTEAAATAEELQLQFVRADTVGTSASFVSGLVDLALERAAQVRGESPELPAVTPGGPLAAGSGACSLNCCLGATLKPTAPQWPAEGSATV